MTKPTKEQRFVRMNNGRHYNDEGRDPYDFHPTPAPATAALLTVEKFQSTIYEPACGEGHISEVLKAAGHNVLSSDLIDRGYGTAPVDFLELQPADMEGMPDFDVVTNPPYRRPLLGPFIRQACRLVPPGGKVAMLLRVGALAGLERKAIFEKNGLRRVWIISNRINFDPRSGARNQGGCIDFAWFVLEPGYVGPWEGGFLLAEVPLTRRRVRFEG